MLLYVYLDQSLLLLLLLLFLNFKYIAQQGTQYHSAIKL